MKVSEIMHRNVEVITVDTTLREAARRMAQLDVGALPVRVDHQLTGMLTDRDIVVRAIARGLDPDETRAAEAMTHGAAFCHADDEVEAATVRMGERQVQRLLVLDDDERLVGIVSLGDLARAGVDGATTTLEEIKAPTKPSALGTPPPQT
jgi:CBS domain-containing protein